MEITSNRLLGLVGLGILLPFEGIGAAYLHTNCAGEISAATPSAQVNMRALPSTSAPIVDTIPAGSTVVVLNRDRKELSPLSRRGKDNRMWYLVVRSRTNRPDGQVPATNSGWIREDLLRLSCPP